MQNKNKKTLAFSLFSIPFLILGMMLLGVSALAEEKEQLVIITLDTEEVFSEPLRYVNSNPEVYANLAAQEEIIETLNPDDREEARTFTHIPVLTASLTESEINNLEGFDLVENIEPEVIHRPELASSSDVIDAPEAYSLGFDGNGVAVAILDTGVDNDHTFLNVVSEACYSNAGGFGGGTTLCPGSATSSTAADSADTDQCSAASGCDHGTHVAGIAAGDGDGAAYTGVARSADIIAIQVFTQFSSGCGSEPSPCLGAYTSDIIAGLNRVLTLHNDSGFTTPIAAANLSLGGGLYSSQATCDAANASTKTAVDSLRAVGIASVIASGNEFSSTQISSPGCISTAVAVGSTTDSDNVSSFSNANAMLDLWAPGSSITSSIIGDGNFGSKSGTSMATPQVAGAWAIIKEKAPDATVAEVLQALQETGTPVTDPGNGLTFSRIDIDDALNHSNFNSIIVDAIDSQTSEAGDTAVVQFSLATAPSADVTIDLSSSDTSEGTIGVSDITIDSADWNNPSANQVTITGVDDSVLDEDVTYLLETTGVTSGDSVYNALTGANVADATLVNSDNETADPLSADWDIIVEIEVDGDSAAEILFYTQTGTGNKGNAAIYDTSANGLSTQKAHFSTWANDWTHITPLDMDNDGTDEISFYESTSGRQQFYETKTNGKLGSSLSSNNWRAGWDIIEAIESKGNLGSEVLFYDQSGSGSNGLGVFYETSNKNLSSKIRQYDNWASSWTHIVPVELNGDLTTEILFYNNGSGSAVFYDLRPNGVIALQSVNNWKTGWDTIVAAEIDGSSVDELIFYDQTGAGSSGLTVMYQLNSKKLGSLIRSYTSWATDWSELILLNTNSNANDELYLYSSGSGTGLIYELNTSGALGKQL